MLTCSRALCRLLHDSIDSTKQGEGPRYESRPVVALFYIAYVVVVPFFMMNLFVGFVIVTFKEEGEQEFKNLQCELEKNQVLTIAPSMHCIYSHCLLSTFLVAA